MNANTFAFLALQAFALAGIVVLAVTIHLLAAPGPERD
jgi:hypothetical protein